MQEETNSLPPVTRDATLGVVALASRVQPELLEAGCAALRRQGWQVEGATAARCVAGDFAGSIEQRTAAFLAMWRRPEVSALVAARGGYGTNYLLPQIDFSALRRTPKPFVGYSDNTALLLALEQAGLPALHGPMVAADFARGAADVASFAAALAGQPQQFEWRNVEGDEKNVAPVSTLIVGEARGALTGGCLTLVAASLGTPWEIASENKILFLEDVNEKTYQLDRMLRQLILAGKFNHVRGVVFGQMLGCGEGGEGETVPQMIVRLLRGFAVPIAFGLPSGHVERGNLTLPFGVEAALRCEPDKVCLTVEGARR